MNRRALHQITRIVVIQGLVIGLVTLLAERWQQPAVAYSIWMGGLVGVLPNLLFALILFCYQGSQYTRQMTTAFYAGEILKWIVVVSLFSAVLLWLMVVPWAVLVGFILAHIAFWLASIQHVRKLI